MITLWIKKTPTQSLSPQEQSILGKSRCVYGINFAELLASISNETGVFILSGEIW